MKKVFSWVLFLWLTLAIIIFVLFQNTNIKKSGEITVSSLKEETQVYFDPFAIPHIEAISVEDSYRSLGYIMAKERLFQMDLLRRLVQGRFSEVFGEKTIKIDKLMRTLRLEETAKFIQENTLSEEVKKLLTAFLEGVHNAIDKGPIPMEFKILGYEPERFKISDIIGVSGYMALTFAEGIQADIITTEMLEKLPDEKMRVLRIDNIINSNFRIESQTDENKETVFNLNKTIKSLENYIPLFHGSNSWVLSGKRTINGYPILANDPHISISNPHIFYEAHIKSPDLEVYGHFIPLSPFPILGHTPTTAWAITMSEIDDVTLYQEKLNPEKPEQYLFKGEWKNFELKNEVIRVKGSNDIKISLKRTIHGPILNGTDFESEGRVLSLNWSFYHPDNNLFQSLYELPKARTVEEFKSAVSHASSPGLNLSWVNKKGDIAWWVMGKYPKLPSGVSYDAVLAGWTGDHEIQGWTSIDENPHRINPDAGVIVTANYKPQGKDFEHFKGYWQPAGRQYLIEELLASKELWSKEDLKKVQTNTVVPNYSNIVNTFLKVLKKRTLNHEEQILLNYLEKWDGNCHSKSVGCTLFSVLNFQTGENLFLDELGQDVFEQLGKTSRFWLSYQHLMKSLDNPFWDNIESQRVESGEEVIYQSFIESVSFLKDKLGHKVSSWEWSRLHKISYIHPLGRVFPLNLLFNVKEEGIDGSRYSINNIGQGVYSSNFSPVVAPATRRIIDMASTKHSYGILPTGNSGNPISPFFNDQGKLYRNGEYRDQLMDWKQIRKLDPLILHPED